MIVRDRWVAWIFVSMMLPVPLMAQTGAIEGLVVDKADEPVRDAIVLMVDLQRKARVNDEGVFRFDNVPVGTHQLQVNARDFGGKLETVDVRAGETLQTRLVFDITIHEELTISATPRRKSISDVSQAVGVMNEEDLLLKMEATLGETLADEPGVSSTYFGPGSSRPIIRGLGGDRIRILEGGLGSGDAASVSADHAVSIDTLNTERIEVLRGPASLRYGSNAVGGVVNILDNRIPEFTSDSPFWGQMTMTGDTAANERSGGANLNGSQGNIAWHADASFKDTDDVEIPGPAERFPEPGEEIEDTGFLENSALETQKGSIGASYIGERGFIGIAGTQFDTTYGVPGHAHGHGHEDEHGHEEDEHEEDEHGHEEDEHGEDEHGAEEPVNIDMEQRRFDLRGGLRFDGFIENLNMRLASTDYTHTELEGDEIGTVFDNEYQELRVEALQAGWGPFSNGSFGFQASQRDFSAVGAEAFVPPNETDSVALYAFEEIERDSWTLSTGIRLEEHNSQAEALLGHHDEHGEEEHGEDEHGEEEHGEDEHHDDEHGEADHGAEAQFFDLSYSTLSASVGFVYGIDRDWSVGVNLTRTERAPTPEELFSNGPHLATQSFEVGNTALNKEESVGLDLTLRRKEGPIKGELSFFTNRFADFIYQQATGDEADGLPVFVYAQEDADFYGGELHLDADLWHVEPHHINLEINADFVRAELDSGTHLPRITPDRLGLGLAYKHPQYWARTEVRYNAEQDRVAPLETSTDSYTMVNASFGFRFFVGSSIHNVLLRGTNLTNEAARSHTSFLKDLILMPGRNISLTYRIGF